MSSSNPFDLLGDDDNDDPSLLFEKQQKKIEAMKSSVAASQSALQANPLPPSQAEARNHPPAPSRGGGFGRGGQARGRGGAGGGGFVQNRKSGKENENRVAGESFDKEREPVRGTFTRSRQPYHGGRRGGYVNGEVRENSERPPRRNFDRQSGAGRGDGLKREGSGKGNLGAHTDGVVVTQVAEEASKNEDKNVGSEKKQVEDNTVSNTKESVATVNEEKKAEDKEMTLEEYERVREEKRKVLLAMKAEERKVELDKELKSMQQLPINRGYDDVFIKLGSDKDSRKLEDNAEREERSKKCIFINEFLKPAEGQKHHYTPGGRGRDGGRSERAPFKNDKSGLKDIKIDDSVQFPMLGVT